MSNFQGQYSKPILRLADQTRELIVKITIKSKTTLEIDKCSLIPFEIKTEKSVIFSVNFISKKIFRKFLRRFIIFVYISESMIAAVYSGTFEGTDCIVSINSA